jgi:enoyl-CoA hydratase
VTPGIHIRKHGAVGRITLDRPQALNALTWEMVRAIEAALDGWKLDASMAMVVIDGEGPRAFCSGGDIAEMFTTASDGDFGYGRRFWRDEYRMNAKMFNFPKPVASFLQGFTMGGGVGVGCHGSHRVVGETSRIAMPECGIGLVPDVGGSLLLARAPGRLGEYLGVTAARMGPGDAILAGFADYYIPEAEWPALVRALEIGGDWGLIDEAARPAPPAPLAAEQAWIDNCFAGETLRDCLNALREDGGEGARAALAAIDRNSPLSMACAVELIRRVRAADSIEAALAQEYRFTWRAAEQGDFVEGIRAKIIDKDNAPRWHHPDAYGPSAKVVARMLAPLGADELKPEDLQ